MKTKLVIFGISGDLSKRKLLPALQRIVSTGEFNDLEIVGVSRQQLETGQVFTEDLRGRGSIFIMDVANLADYQRLKTSLNIQPDEQLLLYLAVPPSAAHQIIMLLGKAGLNMPNVKLLLEKPFGVDLVSAIDMNNHITQFFSGEQVYRIDHYLAKEMTQNIVAFRAGNALFEHVWSNQSIESVEIVASETIGIEGRVLFYEQTGALRDVVQGHLLQLLALVMMEIPGELDWNELPKRRLMALKSLAPADPLKARRGQYRGYQTDAGNLGSVTETFVSLELSSHGSRWSGVPFKLATGKALSEKKTEIRINFKKSHEAQSNCLIFRVQPNEGVEIDLFTKRPGYDKTLESRSLAFVYPEETQLPDAYEQVIVDAIRSQKSLFTSSDEVLESWRVLQPLLDVWNMNRPNILPYEAGAKIEEI